MAYANIQIGDRVVANKSIVATVDYYDPTVGRIRLVQELPGGATNTIEGPVQSYDLELLVQDAVTEAPVEEPATVETPAEAPKDVLTTLDNLS